MAGLILFGAFFVLLLLNVPIGLSLGISSILTLLYENLPVSMVTINMYSATSKFVLLAIPFFILGGNIMEKSGISISSVPAPEPEPDISSLPVYSEQTKTDTIALPRDNSGVDNTNLTNRVGFDPKNLYPNVKRLLVKLDEYGDNLFLQPEARVGFVSPHDPRTCA